MSGGRHGMILNERFRLERVLGQGGSARTWLAVDEVRELELLTADEPPEDLDQDGIPDAARVVVKELPLSRLREWKDLDMFEREARMLGELDHPGIPRSVDHFLEPDEQGGTFYLVQEWIDGKNLLELLQDGERFGEARARELLEQLLPIVHYLHTRKPPLIHRDIKPSNIILRRDGQVALIDFGAVRETRPDGDASSTVAGTFGYMPPEQLQGHVLAASDLYALAATICHLMCRRRPADMTASGEAFMIDFRSWTHISSGFASLLDHMLAPAIDDRLQKARDVMERLSRLDDADDGQEALLDEDEELALVVRGDAGAISKPLSGPRGLVGADYRYAVMGLPGVKRLAPGLALFLTPLVPIGPVLALIGMLFFFKALREGYHNAQIMKRGTIIPARVVALKRKGSKITIQYAYHFNRQRYQALVEVSRRLVRGLEVGGTLSITIDPYEPEDSVPLLGQAGKRLTNA